MRRCMTHLNAVSANLTLSLFNTRPCTTRFSLALEPHVLLQSTPACLQLVHTSTLTHSHREVMMRITLLAAGFVIGE